MSAKLGAGGDKVNSLSIGPHEIHLDGVEVGVGAHDVYISGERAPANEGEILNRLQKNVDEIDQRLAEMKRTIGELRAAQQKAAEKPKDK